MNTDYASKHENETYTAITLAKHCQGKQETGLGKGKKRLSKQYFQGIFHQYFTVRKIPVTRTALPISVNLIVECVL